MGKSTTYKRTHSLCVESAVIVLTFLSIIATSGRILITLGYLTVPEIEPSASVLTLNTSTVGTPSTVSQSTDLLHINTRVMDIVCPVLQYGVLGIAGVFVLEIIIKMTILQKTFFKQPIQIVDGVVVLLSLSTEVCFLVLPLPNTYVLAASYVVVLRLWRLALVCDVKTRKVTQSLSEDIEKERTDREKVEERCERLEEVIRTHIDTKSTHAATEAITQVLAENLSSNLRYKLPSFRGDHDKRVRRSKAAPTDIEMVQFSSEIDTQDQSQNYSSSFNSAEAKYIQARDHKDSFSKGNSGRTNLTSVTRTSNMTSKQRKRRSSTSEYIDYANLNIASDARDSVVYDDVRKETSPSDFVDGGGGGELHAGSRGVKKTDSSTSDASNSSGVCSDMSSEIDKKRKTFQRQNSCPEHLYTNRMTITNDEEEMLEDCQAGDETNIYDNEGFLDDEKVNRHVMAEFDGSKTYRSETGIPMTSL